MEKPGKLNSHPTKFNWTLNQSFNIFSGEIPGYHNYSNPFFYTNGNSQLLLDIKDLQSGNYQVMVNTGDAFVFESFNVLK